MEATIPELGPVHFWSPKSSSFSGKRLHCSRRSFKKLLSPRPSVNKSGAPNFFIQNDKVETNVLKDSIIFLLGMPFNRLVRHRKSLRERAQ